MFDQASILLFIISFLDLALGLFVLLKNPKSRVNRSFFIFSLAILVWINASYFEDELTNPVRMFNLLKLDFASGIFASFALLIFCLDLSEVQIKPWMRRSLLAVPFAFSLLIFTTKAILSGFEVQDGTIVPVFGGANFIYDASIGAALAAGIGVLIWKYRKSSPVDKTKLVYLFTGLTLSSLIAFATNIALNDYIQRSSNYRLYSRLGLFSAIFVVLSSGYSIVKHRLFNLKIIATELLSLGILIFSLFQVLESRNAANLITNLIVFAVLLMFVVMLIRSVDKDIKRKDELQIMSDKLAQANDKLRELDNTKTEFLSIASHQLKTPLTAVKGYVSLALEGAYGNVEPKLRDALNKVYESSDRTVSLVEDLLNMSRIESGRMEFKFEKCRMEDICREVIDTLAIKAKEHNLGLEYLKPESPLPDILIDGAKVREVVSNLVDNAIKYCPKGGVKLKLEQLGDNIRVTVSDTGIGIPQSELPYLFAKFSRGKDTSRLNTGGTGLGLYVGKSMIEQNGGKIWAESEGEGKGSRFIIEIPIRQNEEILRKWL